MISRLEDLIKLSPVKGLAVGFLENNDATFAAWGDFEGKTVNQATVWPVASLTKPVFAYGVMLLVQDALIDLDRPLLEYLPENKFAASPLLVQITARHCLSHSSGFPNWRDETGLKINFEPGTSFNYSSEGLNYLQLVVEAITQMPLGDYLQKALFNPADMRHTKLAVEHNDKLPPYLQFLSGSLLSNSSLSLHTSIADYTKFLALMLNTPNKEAKCLSKPTLSEMLKIQNTLPDYAELFWGLGWALQQSPKRLAFWHWGARGNPTTMNFALGVPAEERALVVFTNHAEGLYLVREIVREYLGRQQLAAFDWLLPARDWRASGRKPD